MEQPEPDHAEIGPSDTIAEMPKGLAWESIEQASSTDAFADKPETWLPKQVKYYFFKLTDDSHANEFLRERYYPILMSTIEPEAKAAKSKRLKHEGSESILANLGGSAMPDEKIDLYFVPEKYYLQYVTHHVHLGSCAHVMAKIF